VKGLGMQLSSSAMNNLPSACEDEVAVCRRCNCEFLKVPHPSQNLGRIYSKCMKCNKFLKWAADKPVSSNGRVKYGSDIFSLSKIRTRVFQFYPNGFRALFVGYFSFCENKKLGIFIT